MIEGDQCDGCWRCGLPWAQNDGGRQILEPALAGKLQHRLLLLPLLAHQLQGRKQCGKPGPALLLACCWSLETMWCDKLKKPTSAKLLSLIERLATWKIRYAFPQVSLPC